MSVVIEKPKLLYQAARESLMDRYVNPLLKAGGRIPPGRVLATELGVDVATVSKALNELSTEGLVERKVGAGTYVIPLTERKAPVGLFYDHVIADGQPAMAVYRVLDEHIQREMMRQGLEPKHYIDLRIPELETVPLPALDDDAKNRRLRGIIVVRSRPEQEEWLASLSLPAVGLEVDYGGATVRNDLAAFARLSVEHLLSRGCRNVGLVCSACLTEPNRRHPGIRALAHGFSQALIGGGLTPREEWMFVPGQEMKHGHYEYGKEAFTWLMSLRDRPDGLVVYTDTACLGLFDAAREAGVDLMAETTIVSHANSGALLPELEGVTHAAFSVADIAAALVKGYMDLEHGEDGGITWILPRIVEDVS